MADSEAFRFTGEEIAKRTSLESIEARGTVRIALKLAGLAPTSVTPAEMSVVLERVLPDELARRGVEDVVNLCRALGERVRSLSPHARTAETPEAVFQRLGGSR